MKSKLTIPFEVKGLNNREFDGHGSTFGNVDHGGDIVVPGAFKRSLADWNKRGQLPPLFWMHQPDKVPGKWLSMSEDKQGLAVKGELAPTPLGDEIHTLLKMEAVRGMSIGYMTVDHDYDKDGNRLIKEADLWEVSVVSLPMNPLAQIVHVKSQLSERGEYVPTIREFEKTLRDVGCSQDVAKRIISKVYEDEERDVSTRSEESDSRREGGQVDLAAFEELRDRFVLAAMSDSIKRIRNL